jgi:hypothetical protein
MTAGNDEQQKRMVDDEGSDEEGGKGDGNGDEGGERATATMVKTRARAARVMVTRVVGDKEGGGNGGNMVRNNKDGLIPVVVQQAVLHSASASLDNVGDDESTGQGLAYMLRTVDVGDDRTTTTMTATSSCRPLMLQHPLILLSLAGPWGRNL